MCGIAGFVLNNPIESPQALLKQMADQIVYRGPDDEGFYATDSGDGRYSVGLAHRRLSIIDLGGGHQPMANHRGTTQVVFNGEIYNYRELRGELESKGYVFHTTSDTESLLAAYDEWGENCVDKLEGMFAFALWDEERQQLFIARDRFGKKPFYFWRRGDEFIFGSEIKNLLVHERVAREVDRSAVWDYLAYRYVPWPRTLFQGIEKLPPGACAVWKNGELAVRRYYTPPDRDPRHSTVAVADPVAGFMRELDKAVESRMVADVPFGAFLSGGIDSSAIVGLMSRHSNEPIKTFSVGFQESTYSELGYAKNIADQFNTDHHELTVSQAHLMDELPKLVRFRDAPVAEPSDIPIYLLSLEARKTVKMVLTGEGADEFLGGYPKHGFDRYADYYRYVPDLLQAPINTLVNALPYKFRRVKTAVANLSLKQWEERMPRWFGALNWRDREALAAFRVDGYQGFEGPPYDVAADNSNLRRILYFDQTSWLPDNLLERGDRMTMAASLEARMPFMDHNLAAYISSLPDDCRIRNGTTKWLLREGMKQILPESILERPKVGFRVPVNEWFQGPMRDYLCDHILSADSRTAAYFNRPVLERYVNDHVNGVQNHEKLLWALLNLEIWHREYGMSA
ncbi:asparagine synthase (glutamine-hydrolyzing) [endosymbiont of Lamellibrachia barhami]|uniref:asparagine synthase (glutamine-hydrolyzing) n=1 Tax=endosymbiont of Lamellibrachia barhami TaxID=205975 RepID=UPI0015AF65BF|nr:asparagine synthase (glutamine-hydrolyzing) [endosymbiont of Lamellibrachia barhami]